MTLTSEAKADCQDRTAKQAVAAAAARAALQAAGLDAVRVALARVDGTFLVLKDLGLTVVYTDEPNAIVAVSDQTVTLVAQRVDGAWVVRLGEVDGLTVTVRGSAVRSLADLGSALAGGS